MTKWPKHGNKIRDDSLKGGGHKPMTFFGGAK